MPISQNSGVYRVGAQYGVLRQQQNLRDPDLVLWLQRGTDMFTDVSAAIPAVTNDPVAAWKDGAVIASQATLANRPTRQAGGELAWDGGDALVGNTAMRELTRNRSQLAIYVSATPTAFGTDQKIIFFSIGTNAGATRLALGVTPAGLWQLSWRQPDTDGLATLSSAATLNQRVALCGMLDFATPRVRFFIDGVQVAVTTPAFSVPMTDSASAGAAVGSIGASQYWNGSIFEIRLYHAAHDAATVAQISAEMAAL
jgi:hypothetical protein